jgi:hypothetical protein
VTRSRLGICGFPYYALSLIIPSAPRQPFASSTSGHRRFSPGPSRDGSLGRSHRLSSSCGLVDERSSSMLAYGWGSGCHTSIANRPLRPPRGRRPASNSPSHHRLLGASPSDSSSPAKISPPPSRAPRIIFARVTSPGISAPGRVL